MQQNGVETSFNQYEFGRHMWVGAYSWVELDYLALRLLVRYQLYTS